MVYVEPGAAILDDHDGNATSIRDFAGYHGAFAGRHRPPATGWTFTTRLVIKLTPAAITPVFPGLTPFGSMTLMTASHEIAGRQPPTPTLATGRWAGTTTTTMARSATSTVRGVAQRLRGAVIVGQYDVAYVPTPHSACPGHCQQPRLRQPLQVRPTPGSVCLPHGLAAAVPGGQSHAADTLFALLANSH